MIKFHLTQIMAVYFLLTLTNVGLYKKVRHEFKYYNHKNWCIGYTVMHE